MESLTENGTERERGSLRRNTRKIPTLWSFRLRLVPRSLSCLDTESTNKRLFPSSNQYPFSSFCCVLSFFYYPCHQLQLGSAFFIQLYYPSTLLPKRSSRSPGLTIALREWLGYGLNALGASNPDPPSDIILCGTTVQSSGRSRETLQQPCYGGVVSPGKFKVRLHNDHGHLDASVTSCFFLSHLPTCVCGFSTLTSRGAYSV